MKRFGEFILNEAFLTKAECLKAYHEGIKEGSIGKCSECGSPNLSEADDSDSRQCVDCGHNSTDWRIQEDEGAAPTNSAGSANIAGIGIQKPGDPTFAEPGVPVKKKLQVVGPPVVDVRMFADKVYKRNNP